MKLVCSWCTRELNDVVPETPQDVSHGICPECAFHMRASMGMEFKAYLEGLGIPLVIMDREANVLFASSALNDVIEVDSGLECALPAGLVFECENAFLPGGCGQAVHCEGCAIRTAVRETWHFNRTHLNIQTHIHRRRKGEPKQTLRLVFSTIKTGDLVLLRIDAVEVDYPC